MTLTQLRKQLVGKTVKVNGSDKTGTVKMVKQMAEPMCYVEKDGKYVGAYKPSELSVEIEVQCVLGYTLSADEIIKASTK